MIPCTYANLFFHTTDGSQDPYGGANNPKSQQRRNEAAYFTYVYQEYISKIREKEFSPTQKGVPLEYFEWERVIVDEIHECLCTSKDELKEAKAKADKNEGFFREKNRRAGREVGSIHLALRFVFPPPQLI